jgi:hypothetical protein
MFVYTGNKKVFSKTFGLPPSHLSSVGTGISATPSLTFKES